MVFVAARLKPRPFKTTLFQTPGRQSARFSKRQLF